MIAWAKKPNWSLALQSTKLNHLNRDIRRTSPEIKNRPNDKYDTRSKKEFSPRTRNEARRMAIDLNTAPVKLRISWFIGVFRTREGTTVPLFLARPYD